MRISMMKSKIHRAIVTEANPDYEGSITIDQSIMESAGIVEYEKVHVLDIVNGQRIVTYAIAGKPDSGDICINGAAAKVINKGDKVIIVSYADLDVQEIKGFSPKKVLVDGQNKIL
ncbi:MAG: aspartate 1-decarboxylase [Deltaproteobacteria bacterium CG07_land_8_20_14_0_80_38_7]|nr:MAG: aspartate 1-decarboxylase [Deltaproteobacteria bacterium CG07_land_8_20_14_0_80_38_7]